MMSFLSYFCTQDRSTPPGRVDPEGHATKVVADQESQLSRNRD